MLSDKMQRFLKSMGFQEEELDSFDLEFESISRNRFNKEQFDIRIVKNEPWNYDQLMKFQAGLLNLKFPYPIRFSYKNNHL